MSTILHGLLLLLCVIAIPGILNMVPLAVLAGVLLMVGYKLAKPSIFREMARLGWSQLLPFMATVAGVVFTDLLKGIGIGMVVAIFIILRNSYRHSHFVQREETENGNERVRLTLAQEVIFLNKATIRKELNEIPEGSEVVIDMSKSAFVDHDVLEIIQEFRQQAMERDIQVEIIKKEQVNVRRKESATRKSKKLVYQG
jgi:MFS superfamily sulfate permease-like transporter